MQDQERRCGRSWFPPFAKNAKDGAPSVGMARTNIAKGGPPAQSVGKGTVLLRVEGKAGHGAGTPVSKQVEEGTDVFSFLSWRLGVR
jgi:hypothetical protein